MKVRKMIRKRALGLNDNEWRILYFIARQDDSKIITQTEVANKLNKSISTLNHNFTKLRNRGLIDKHNKLTVTGLKFLRYFKEWDKTFEKKIRAHNIKLIVYLQNCPDNLEKIKNHIMIPFTNNKYNGLKVELKDFKILFYSKRKAVVVLNDIFGNNDEEIAAALCDCVGQLKTILEDRFPGLKVDRIVPARIFSMHVAVLDSYVAKSFILKTGMIFNNNRVCMDSSHGRFELESVNANNALEDIEFLIKYEDLAKEVKRLKALCGENESTNRGTDSGKNPKK